MLFVIISVFSWAQDTTYLKLKAQSGDNISNWLEKYEIQESCDLEKFCVLNSIEMNDYLILGKTYCLPILVYDYNGKSIRSSINNYDYQLALKIQGYNDSLATHEVKSNDFRKD